MKQMDLLQVYVGEELCLGKITLRQPTLRDIINYGEVEFYSLLHAITATPSDYKSVLWDNGVDWTQMDRIEFFYTMTRSLTKERTEILFGDLDFSTFDLYRREDGDAYMYDEQQDIIIDLYAYSHICDYLCKAFHIKQHDTKPGTEFTKKMMIEWDRDDRNRATTQSHKSILFDQISALVNHPAFKYGYREAINLTHFQFMDSFNRVQRTHSATVAAIGFYNNVDFSKFDRKLFNWTGPIS